MRPHALVVGMVLACVAVAFFFALTREPPAMAADKASSPLLIFAHPSFAPNDMAGAIALAKEKPGTISYSTPGVGSIQQLSLELVAYRSGAKFIHVPYRGGAPALNDVIAGHVPMSVLSV